MIQIRALSTIGARDLQGLGDLLIDCVEGGASVSFMLPMSRAGRSIDPMNTNFTHAVIVASIDVIFTVIVVTTGLHALQWAIAKHRGTLFTAGPETMYQ